MVFKETTESQDIDTVNMKLLVIVLGVVAAVLAGKFKFMFKIFS